jgi:hypothetical protein
MKQAIKSKTIIFNVLMGGIEALHASIQLFEPIVTADHFALISVVLGIIHGMGGVYLRTITNVPLSNK